MDFDNAATPWVRTLGKAALLFAAYFLSACFAITLSRNIGSVAAIWPATAVALGVLLLSPARDWPAYLLAAGAANLAAGIATGVPPAISIGFTAFNLMEILLAAGLLRRLRAPADWLGSVRSLMMFLGVAAILAPTAATVLRSALSHVALQVPYWSAWQTRWIADIVGMLIVAPLMLAWSRREAIAPGVRRPALEIAGIAAGLVAATGLTIGSWVGGQAVNHVALILALPFQIWATLRFGARGATAANAFVALMGIGALLTGVGSPANPGNLADALLTLQTLLATTAVTTLVLVAAISERRAAEIRLRDAVESVGEGFALFDADDRLVLSNSTHQRMYAKNKDLMVPGVRFEDILRGSAARGQHPDAIDRIDEWVAARMQRHLNPGDPIEQDRGDGQWLLICERRTSEGGIVGTWTDISRLKAQEAALIASEQRMRVAESRARAAEARLRDAIESMNEGLTAYDSQGRLVLSNRRMQEIYPSLADLLTPGAKFEDFLREGVARGVFDTGGEATDTFLAEHMNLPADRRKDVEIDLADGRWLLVSRQRTSDGGTVHVRTDITRLKQHEQALRESEERLRGMLRELEESHAQLERQSIQMTRLAGRAAEQQHTAEAASVAKSQFLANISHELRTPLNAILGFSEIMKSEMFGPLGSPQYRGYAADIHDSGSHLLTVINDILDLSKIEAGKFELNEEDCDPARLVRDAVRFVAERAGSGGLGLQQRLQPALPAVRADGRLVKQILLNLLSNAIKFTPAGGTITVSADVESQSGLALTVADTGIGIAPDQLERVLQPFTQVENTLTRTHAGTGLGLPLCKSLIELHGGRLALESTVGRGTTVTITLPKERVLAARPAASAA
ncbi:MAG TPA: PAS-domain containing protein [Candidatus Angelobacter sp.]|nr:PAS-domain containing protein [Candidatus Angelobacter sp.]